MSQKRKHITGLSKSDLERIKGASRVLRAYKAFGVSLLKGETPTLPPLCPTEEARSGERRGF